MRISFTVKQLLALLIAIVVCSFLFSGMHHAIITYSSTGADWISASIQATGNVAGGIIGGIVAYIVASYQISSIAVSDRKKKLESLVTLLKLICEELEENRFVIESAKPLSSTGNVLLLKAQLTDEIWSRSISSLILEQRELRNIYISYRKLALVRNLEDGQVNDLVLTETVNQINQTLKIIDAIIAKSEHKIAENC